MKKKLVVFIACNLFFIPLVVYAETMYITDNLEVMVRGGKGTEYKILAIKKANEPVEVLNTEGDYSYVRLENEVEGWVLKRYLTRELPKPMVIANLTTEIEQLNAKHTSLSQEYQKLKEQKQSIETSAAACAEKNKSLEQQYQELKSSSANVIQLQDQCGKLQEENKKNSFIITQLTEQNQQLRNYTTLLWFVAGAATLLTGLTIGVIIQNLRFKKRRSISF
jgi:SH3 domain protein